MHSLMNILNENIIFEYKKILEELFSDNYKILR